MNSDNKLAHRAPGGWSDTPELRSEFTSQEKFFLRLHAQFGPIVPLKSARKLLSDEVPEAQLGVFNAPRREGRFVSTARLARILVQEGALRLAPAPGAPADNFSDDDNGEGAVIYLGSVLSPFVVRGMSLYDITFDRLHARFGPWMTVPEAAKYFGYGAAALTASIKSGAVPIQLVPFLGRRLLVISTSECAEYLSRVAALGIAE